MDITIISGGDMEFTPKGRKSQISPELLNKVRELIKKQGNDFIVFQEYGMPNEIVKGSAKVQKTFKAKQSAKIRAIAKALGMSVKIGWHKNTVPAGHFYKA
jgi:hypothetical protein